MLPSPERLETVFICQDTKQYLCYGDGMVEAMKEPNVAIFPVNKIYRVTRHMVDPKSTEYKRPIDVRR